MLNINQNFDLKAPVFNFDRDYFNSVEELNAYGTRNVPKYFVTNVAGMLYQFTDRGWAPMIMAEIAADGKQFINLGCTNAYFKFLTFESQTFPENLTLVGKGSEYMSILSPDSLQIRTFRESVSISIDGIDLGNDNKVRISRPINYEGGVISGIKSITAFANPSATKVWATDGSTVDLTTKANASDVLLKKSASDGYYIEENGNVLGRKAFATNSDCTASGNYAHAEGVGTAIGYSSHAEGISTASGNYTHSEGSYTLARGINSHSEGDNTIAGGFCSHVQGIYNIDSVNAIHSVGIGDATTRKNAEYIYAKNNTNGTAIVDDPKNGYKYLIGVGGYDGISTDNTTYKSVQEVIADLTARIEQLETKVKALEDANTPA